MSDPFGAERRYAVLFMASIAITALGIATVVALFVGDRALVRAIAWPLIAVGVVTLVVSYRWANHPPT